MKNKLVIFCLAALLFTSCESTVEQGPNIVFIMSDDHAWQAVGAYGSKINQTPAIDQLAGEGMLFTNACVSNSICAPSRAVILTGKFSHLNGVKGNSEVFDGTQVTFPKLLQTKGYKTAMVGKWHLKSHPTGFNYWNVLPGQGDYYNPDFIKMGKDTTYTGYVTDVITQLSLDWLKEQKKMNAPFCLMMHHKAPHRSWMPALRHLSMYDEQTFPLPDNFFDSYENRQALQVQMLTVAKHMDVRMDFKIPCDTCDTASVNFWAPDEYWRRMDRLKPDERRVWDDHYAEETAQYLALAHNPDELIQWMFRRYMEDYLRCIAAVDESVGQVTQWLKDNQLDENTMVIYTSDQGFYLGEHGLFDKRFMYEEALRTPLIVKYPKLIAPQQHCDLLVQNLDLAPTLLDIAGIEIPNNMQGESLKKLFANEPGEWREAIYYHYYEKGFGASPHFGIRNNRFKLIRFYDVVDSWEFYDLEADPQEMKNEMDNEIYSVEIKSMKEKLIALQEQYKDTVAIKLTIK
jgi:arylsulfatase A-like enzyme